MVRYYAFGVVVKVAALVTVAVLGYCLVNHLQHLPLARMYDVAGTF